MTKNQIDIMNTAIATYGQDSQMLMAIEEMSELTKAICKYKRYGDNVDDIAEEIADVTIMLEQLKMMFDVYPEVEMNIDLKLKRLERRLAYGEA
jgi:NTP pyrophosphatase (non-canonical NTP hydrolase)